MLQDGESIIAHGDTIQIGDLEECRVQALKVSEEVNRAAMLTIGANWSADAEVIVLKIVEEDDDLEPKERVLVVPPAPDGNENRLKSIPEKWRDVESFTFLCGSQRGK